MITIVAARLALAWVPQAGPRPSLRPRAALPALLPRMCEAERRALEAERLELEEARKALEAEREALRMERGEPPAATSTVDAVPDVGPMVDTLRTALESMRGGVELPVEELLEAATEALEEARKEQRREIESLKVKIPLAEAAYEEQRVVKLGNVWEQASTQVDERQRSEEKVTSFADLLTLSEEDASDADDEARRVERAQQLSVAIFDFHSFRLASPTVDDNGESCDTEVAVPGEGVLLLNRTRARLALLERHEAAGVVEYRLFGAALSASVRFCAAAASGLPALADNDQAVAQAVGRYLRFLPNFDAEELRADLATEATTEEEKRNAEELMAAAKGLKRPPFWLEQHGNLARRWQSLDSEEDFEAVLATSFPVPVFPALVFLLCVRLGSFEPVAAYVVARTVARLNALAIEPAKALVPAGELDRQIAVQEQQLIDDFAQSAVLWFSVGTFAVTVLGAILIFYAWGFVSDTVYALLTGPAAPDPFAGL